MKKNNHTIIMLKGIGLCCLLLAANQSIFSQSLSLSGDRSYTVTYTPNQATIENISTLPDSISCPVVEYIDGLGRPSQTQYIGITPTGNDLVTHTEYDNLSNPYKTWLPIVTNGHGTYVYPSSVSLQATSLYNDAAPFNLTIYDGSPLNRAIKKYGPGANWQNDGMGVNHYIYGNDQSDSLRVKKFYQMSSTTYRKDSTYATGTLSVTVDKDEDGHKTWTFTDNLGRAILTRTYNNNVYNSTYYIYNELNQLLYVLPPLASDPITSNTKPWSIGTSSIMKFGYFYCYDDRGNCVSKTLPGNVKVYTVYDKAGRPVLTQDNNQMQKNIWIVTKYDQIGRPIMRGSIEFPSGVNLTYLMDYCRNILFVETYNGNSTNYGYTNNVNYGEIKLSEVIYYDNYSFINTSWIPSNRQTYLSWNSFALDGSFVNSLGDVSAKGLMTGTISFLSDNQASKKYTAYYYDQKGQVVQKNGTSHLNATAIDNTFGIELYSYAYDFKGNILHERHQHRGTNTSMTYFSGTKFSYDHAGRLLTTRNYITSESSILTTSTNSYNELGQLASKTYGNNIETQNYSYNIRGWIKEINGSLFSEKLYYERNSSNQPCNYNGNISEYSWKRLTGNIHTYGWKANTSQWKDNWSTYNFTYDNLNRLIIANNSNLFSENANYDKHGNITSMTRGGITESGWTADGITPNHTMETVDQLSYTYNGNRLIQVSDYSTNNQLFTGGQDFKNNSTENYLYDYNGNMKSNFDKNMTNIHYNLLNLPDTVQMRNGHMATYSYDATGKKTFATYKTATGSSTLMPIGSTLLNNTLGYTVASSQTTMYLDNVKYVNNALIEYTITDGILKRYNPVTDTYPTMKYNYFIKDHLGNVRVVVDQDGIIKQVNNYYPFGMEYGESTANQTELNYQDKQFANKEFDRKFEINMYDFGARNYDATIGRWSTMDPLAEMDCSVSPYVFCGNNPIRFIDPNGLIKGDINDPYKLREVVVMPTGAGCSSSESKYFLNTMKQSGSANISKNNESVNGSSLNGRFPLDKRVESYLKYPGRFGDPRDRGSRKHGGSDLYANSGAKVYAVKGGLVIKSPYKFYRNSSAIEINHGNFIARYSEIDVLKELQSGSIIKQGQLIGHVSDLLQNQNMLHFEMYSGNTTGPLTNRAESPYMRRSDIIDPTNFLNSTSINK